MRQTAPCSNQDLQQMAQKPSVHCNIAFQRRNRRSGGFTVVEILVVVSISLLLLGIGAAVAIDMVADMRREQTRAMMKALLGANTEFKAVRNQPAVNHDGTYPINWPTEGLGSASSCERYVAAMMQVASAEQMLTAAINSSTGQALDRTYKDTNGNKVNEIYDRWGTQLEYRSSNDGTGTGPGTGVANKKLPVSPFPFFVSAGPDKTFGNDDDIHTLDN